MTSKKGVYFSANDRVLPWATAFLNSFRRFNPDLPLYLIPFNQSCDELIKLSEKYKFKIYRDSSFARLEKIGQDFELGHADYGPYWFRRYAAFWGPLDEFMYLDARGQIAEVLGNYCKQGWAGQRGNVYEQNGSYYLWDHGGLNHKKQLFMLHWGGIQLSPSMPERKLFLEFLNKNTLLQRSSDLLKLPGQQLYKTIRKSRWINSQYHALRKG